MNYIIVDDSVGFKSRQFAPSGGTALTLKALVDPNKDNVELIPTPDLKFIDCVEKQAVWIFGNNMGIKNETIATNIYWLLENLF